MSSMQNFNLILVNEFSYTEVLSKHWYYWKFKRITNVKIRRRDSRL